MECYTFRPPRRPPHFSTGVYTLNDVINVSFDWTDGWAWDADDRFEIAVFTSSDDTLAGTLNEVWSGSYVKADNDAYLSVAETITGAVTAADANRDLWIVFSTDQTGSHYAGVDNVKLWVVREREAPDEPVVIDDAKISVMTGGSDIVIAWVGTDGATYTVSNTADLVNGPWELTIGSVVGVDGTMMITSSLDRVQNFYKILQE